MKLLLKKAIKQPIIQPTAPEIIQNVVPKTEDVFVNDDEFDSFRKPERMTINIGQPKDENYDDLVMISDDDETKISKSLTLIRLGFLKVVFLGGSLGVNLIFQEEIM